MSRPVAADCLLVGFLSFGFLVLSANASDSPAAPEVAEYSRAADSIVFEVLRAGGMVRWVTEFRLYGDGRLVVQKRSSDPTSRLLQECETLIPADVLEELVDRAVAAGLLEFTESRLSERRQELGRSSPVVSDDADFRVTINLEEYASSGEPAVPRSNTFAITSAASMARVFPEIPEYSGARDLLQSLSDFYGAGVCVKP